MFYPTFLEALQDVLVRFPLRLPSGSKVTTNGWDRVISILDLPGHNYARLMGLKTSLELLGCDPSQQHVRQARHIPRHRSRAKAYLHICLHTCSSLGYIRRSSLARASQHAGEVATRAPKNTH